MEINLKRLGFAISVIIFILSTSGCTRIIHKAVYPTLVDGRYDSEFPYNNASDQLEDISKSVKMLNYISYYKAYLFTESQNITNLNISEQKLEDIAVDNVYFNNSVSGTATIIYHDGTKVALLTCAHIGNQPDTVFTYFDVDAKIKKIKQVSIKVREHYYVNEIPGEDDFETIAIDNKRYLAILTKKVSRDPFQDVRQFRYPFGDSQKLELGNFVYIIGYPMGHKMITRGIVSNTRDVKSSSFLIDALFNRGFSGGVILAIKDGVPNFELVGLAKSVSASNDLLLVPSVNNGTFEYNPNIPYEGDLNVKRYEGINYGITYTISSNEIIRFLTENNKKLIENGIDLQLIE